MHDPKTPPPESPDEILELLVRWYDGALSEEEERALQERLRRDPAFREEFVRHSLQVQMIRRSLLAGSEAAATASADKGTPGLRPRSRPATEARRPAPRRFMFRIAAAAAVLLAGLAALLLRDGTSEEAPVVARLRSVTGTVHVLGEKGKLPATAESDLHSNQGIEVAGAASRARVTFKDGTWMDLGPDTRISSLEEAAGGKRVWLEKGSVAAGVTRQPTGRPMIFSTPQGEATVLGTTLRITVAWDKLKRSTRLDVEEGKVRLKNLAGKTVDVPTGHYAVAAAGVELAATSAAAPARLVVTFLETKGHGLAIVVQTPGNRTYLIDTGSGGKDVDNGRDTIAPFLQARGVKEIDGIVISHPQSDHFGGAAWLIQNMTVKRLIDSGYEGRGQTDAYRALRRQVRARGGEHVVVHAGDVLDWGRELTVELLSPPKEFLLQEADPAKVSEQAVLNNNSLILRIQHGNIVFLFPGDAYGTEGSFAATRQKDRIRATVLCAPHHGFNSTPGYAQLVKPEVVVASCLASYTGPLPSPADQTELIYKPVGAKVYATAWHGNVEVLSDGSTVTVRTERPRVEK